MDNVMSFLEGRFEILSYYPKWFMYLISSTYGLGMASLFLLAVLYPGAASRRNAERQRDSVAIALGLSPTEPLEKKLRREGRISYHAGDSPDVLEISPELNAYPSVSGKGDIGNLMIEWGFPYLDLKVLNNSAQAILISEIVLDVQESRPEGFSLPTAVSDPDDLLTFTVLNEGQEPLRDTVVKYQVKLSSGKVSGAHSVALGGLDDQSVVDISPAMAEFGMAGALMRSLDGLENATPRSVLLETNNLQLPVQEWHERVQEAAGSVKDDHVTVTGTLSGWWKDAGQVKHDVLVPFSVAVRVLAWSQPPDYSRSNPSYSYDIMLDGDRKNYKRRVFVAQTIKPGEPDRFYLRVAAPMTSKHRFRLKLVYNRNRILESQPVALTVFVPRSDEQRLVTSERFYADHDGLREEE
jgi:hypothetical protein